VALSIDTGEALEMGFDMQTRDAIYALNYHKAAMVLHMLREIIGLDGYARLCRTLHELDADLTTDTFREFASQVYGEDLSWFFDAWLDSPDIPSFRVRYGYRKVESSSSRYELTGTIEQTGASVRHPVLLRIPLEAAPPLEQTVWVEPQSTDFSIILPSPPRGLEFDPYGDMLHRGVEIEVIESADAPREEEAA
jgi:aminopeptidase N